MGKGTPSMGKRATKKVHVPCRRCGKNSYNIRKGYCASCGYGKSSRMRKYSWSKTH